MRREKKMTHKLSGKFIKLNEKYEDVPLTNEEENNLIQVYDKEIRLWQNDIDVIQQQIQRLKEQQIVLAKQALQEADRSVMMYAAKMKYYEKI